MSQGDKKASIPEAAEIKMTAAIKAIMYLLKNGIIGWAYFFINCFLIILSEKITDKAAIMINTGMIIKFCGKIETKANINPFHPI